MHAAETGMLETAKDVRAAPRGALIALSLAMLLSSLGTSIANVALPRLALAFDARFQDIQWVVLAYLLAITSLIVGLGRLGDIVGRKRLLLVGAAIFTAASLLCGAAPTLALLIAARALQGVGAAIMMTLAIAFVAEIIPKEKTGAAMGLLGAMSALGTALGPALGGILIALFEWRAIFLIQAPVGLAALVMAYRNLPASAPTASAARFDALGAAVLAATLAAYALATTMGHGRLGVWNIVLIGAATLGLAVFVFVERRAASPLIKFSAMDRPLVRGLAANAVVAAVMMTTLVVGPFYLARALHCDAAALGLAMAVGPIVAALAGAPAGRLVDRIGAQRASRIGLMGATGGCALLAAAAPSAGLIGYVAPLAVLTASYALFQAANNTALMAHVGAADRGRISGLLNLSRNLGLLTGASVMGAVFAIASGADMAEASARAIADGMRATFGLATIMVVLATYASWSKRHRVNPIA